MDQQKHPPTLHQRIWNLTWPMILSNLAMPFLGLVDTAVMGHLDDSRYLAAIAIGATLFATLYWSVAFLKAGTTGLTAHFFGQQAWGSMKTLVLQALVYAVVLGLLMVLLQRPILAGTLLAFAPPIEVAPHVADYSAIRIWGAPASLMTFALTGWYIGQQNTRIPMIVALSTNMLNAILNVLFVYQFELGVAGVAWGTLISEYSGLALCIYFMRSTLRSLPDHIDLRSIRSLKTYQQLSKTNLDYFVRTLFLMMIFVFFTRQGAIMGKDMVAVNELLKQFLLIIALALDGFAHAAEALAGAAWSARKRDAFFDTIKAISLWSIATALLLTLVFGLGGSILVSALTDIPEIIELANQYLWWIIPLPIVSVWCFMFDGIFIGTLHTREMRNNMIFSSIVVFFPIWFAGLTFGNDGLWLAMWSFFIARGVGLAVLFHKRFVQRSWEPTDALT